MTPYLLQSVAWACQSKTNSLCLEFQRGATTMASVAATAALLGLFGTVTCIQNSFHSLGSSRSGGSIEIARNLGVSLFPTLLGLFACVASLLVHRFIIGRVAYFRLEMENESTALVSALLLHVRRTGNSQPLHFARSRLSVSPGYAETPDTIAAPTLGILPHCRHGLWELLSPHLKTIVDVEQVLEWGYLIAIACGITTALCYFDSPYTALTFCACMALSGLAIRYGSRPVATALPLALLTLATSRYDFYFGFYLSTMVWGFAGILLAASALRAAWSPLCRKVRRHHRHKRAASTLLSLASAPVAFAMLVPSPFLIRHIVDSAFQMEPTIHEAEEVTAIQQRWLGYPLIGEVVVFGRLDEVFGTTGVRARVGRIVGLPGDRIQIRSGALIRNGARIEEPYLRNHHSDAEGDFPLAPNAGPLGSARSIVEHLCGPSQRQNEPFLVPSGSAFIAADDRDTLVDSRILGPVPFDEIQGRVILAHDLDAPAWYPWRLVR